MEILSKKVKTTVAPIYTTVVERLSTLVPVYCKVIYNRERVVNPYVVGCASPSDSDSDSELSEEEHSSSYASSHSSDSEDDDVDVKPKWNNERTPVHSTPKSTCTFATSVVIL